MACDESLCHFVAPLGDARVLLTLLTTWLVYAGLFLVYTYIGSSFDRATGGDARVLAALLLLWGVAATVGNVLAGRLTDRYGSRRIINASKRSSHWPSPCHGRRLWPTQRARSSSDIPLVRFSEERSVAIVTSLSAVPNPSVMLSFFAFAIVARCFAGTFTRDAYTT